MQKKWLVILLVLLVLPLVSAVTQQFINKYNLNQPNNPVVVASNNSFGFSISRAGRTLMGVTTPQVGDVVVVNYKDDIIYNFTRMFHDNLIYYKDYTLQGPSFYGHTQWLQNFGEITIDTTGFTPGWHHVLIYSAKFNPQTWTFSNNSWKLFSFEVQPKTTVNQTITPISCNPGQTIGDVYNDAAINRKDIDILQEIILGKIKMPQNICCIDINKDNNINVADVQTLNNIITNKISPGTCPTTQIIGPLPSRNVSNCVTPSQPQTSVWQIDKSTTLCLGTYDLLKGVEIVKDHVKLDCNGATLSTSQAIPLISFKKGGVEITNCKLINKDKYEEISILGEGEDIKLQNNLFDSNVIISRAGNVNINYNKFDEGELIVQEVDKAIIENNIFINECGSSGSLHEYGSINLRKNVQRSQIKNNEIEDKNGCSNDKGIVIHYQNYDNIISNNNIKGMIEGIFFRFEDNTNNVFSKNRIENSEIGILIRNPKDLDLNKNNKFIKNNFINNNIQIEDHNKKPNLYENNYITGFSDNPQQCNDTDNDDICNNPYLIYSIPPQYGGTQQTQIDLKPSKISN